MPTTSLTDTQLELCQRGEAAWPAFQLDRAAFMAYVDQRPALMGTIDEAAAVELYLCCACNHGISAAQVAFESRYLDVIGAAVAHMKLDRASVDEIKQRVRHKLLVAPAGGVAKVDDYAGQGKLAGLVKVVAVRTALDMVRKHKRQAQAASYDLAQLPSADKNPELQFIKESYRVEFSRAFEAAVRALTSRERNLLRMHQLSGVTLEQLAEMYDVHRATVVRWLAKARATILSQTKKNLRSTLKVSAEELDGLMELLQSRFDVSVERIMQTLG